MRKILHLHGIGSAEGGATASVLKKLFSDIDVISPDIPVRPLEAFAFISKLVAGNEFDFVHKKRLYPLNNIDSICHIFLF